MMYGVAYYPEYELEDRMDLDFQMMKKAGMNVIRIAESTWSTWEPQEGVYDFSLFRKTLKKAEEQGMWVIVGTPTYAVPAWLVKKDPKVLAETKSGPGMYGARQIMDITNKTYLEAAEKLIRKMMEIAREYACVIGYQIDNETKHYGTAGAQVQKGFVEYLQKKFQTVEELNRRFGLAYWSNSIGTWEDFPDVRGTINGSLAAEFEKYQRTLAADFLQWQRNIVEEYRKPDQFVTHNFDFDWKADEFAPFGHSYGVQPGINHYEASRAVTLSGCDIYHPTQDDLTGSEIAYCGDSIRSLKGEPYLVLETEAQAFRYWTPYPGQLRQQAFSHLASGALGVEYWHWHSIHNSFETYWKGVLSHDMEENEVYREAMTIGADFKRLSPYLDGVKKKNQIALVVDNVSQTALKYFPIGDQDHTSLGEHLSYNDVVRTYYDALYEQNMECDVIDVQALPDKINNYKMLVTPALYCASDETIALLRQFVAEGGVLVASFKSFFTNEEVQVRSGRQPYGLTDVFGVSYQMFTRPGKTKLKDTQVTVWQELLMPEEDTETCHYQHKYWEKYAGISRHTWKKGYAVYVGCWCEKNVLKEELRGAADWAGIPREAQQFPVIIRNLENRKKEQIHFVFHYAEEEGVYPCAYAQVMNLLDGKKYKKGDLIPLRDWDTLILMEIGS